jgi:hypothetical protein
VTLELGGRYIPFLDHIEVLTFFTEEGNELFLVINEPF